MAINLASKFSSQLATIFTNGSYIKGNTSAKYDFTGVKSLKVYTPITVDEVDYVRSGNNRYGEGTEVQDIVQEMKVTQDKAFRLMIDKGNSEDQLNIKKAGEILRRQLDEKSTPIADKYAFKCFANLAGKIATVSQIPNKSNIVDLILSGGQELDDNQVPSVGRFIYMTAEMYKLVRMSPEFISLEALGVKAISKGEVGEIDGMRIIKVPKGYLPANCYFIIGFKDAMLMPYKIADTKIHEDPPGISGSVIEGRHYYDAFVLGAKASGVYALVLEAAQQAAPTATCATPGTATMVIESAGATKIIYTLDGTDPRFNEAALVYSTPVATTEWKGTVTVRAVAYSDKFTSNVTENKFTVA